MSDELVAEYVDRAKFLADTEFIKGQLGPLLEMFAKLTSIKKTITVSSNLKDVAAGAELGIKANSQLVQSTRAVMQVIDQRFASEAKLVTIGTDYFKQTQKNKLIIAEQTKEMKLQAQVDLAQSGSIQKATALRAKMYFEQTKLNLATKEGAERSEVLKTRIDSLSNFIQKNSDKLTQQKINIGNYGASVKTAVATIEDELKKLNAQLAQTEKGSAAFDTLTKKATVLKTVSASLANSYTTTFNKDGTETATSAVKELRTLQNAAKVIGTEFGTTSSVFTKFIDNVGARKDELTDIQNAINFKSSDTQGLDATLQGIQAVTGAYGAYQAAAVLAGGDTEEMQASMQKLQATLTLVSSVQAVVNALQSESALIQGALAAKAKLLAAAEALASFSIGTSAVAITAQSAAAVTAVPAVSALAVSQQASGIASLQMAVANGTATLTTAALGTAAVGTEAALGGVVVAEAAVATGATAMATAVAATGIGLLIVAAAIAIYKIVDALQEQAAVTESVKQANKAYSDSIKTLIESTKEYDRITRITTQNQLDDLDRIIQKRKALGVSEGQALALDKKLAEEKQKAAQAEVTANGITAASLEKKRKETEIAAGAVREQQQVTQNYIEYVKKNGDSGYEATMKSLQKETDAYQANFEAKKAIYDRDAELFATATGTKLEVEVITNQASKLAADERRRFVLESARIDAELRTSQNNKVLADEKSTLAQRLAAVQNNLRQQRKIINAENAATQNDPTVSSTDKTIAAKKAAAEIVIATRESEQELAGIREDFRLRDLQATQDIKAKLLEVIISNNDAIAQNEALAESKRLEALQASIQARKQALEDGLAAELSEAGISDANIERIKKEGFFEIANKKITNKELEALIVEYNAAQLALAQQSSIERIAIVKDYFQQEEDIRNKALKGIARANDLQVEDRTDTYNNEIIELNGQYTKKKISAAEYAKQRKAIDDRLAKDLLIIQLDEVEKSLAATVGAAETEKRIRAELQALENFTGPQSDDEKRVHAERIKILTAELEKVQEVVGKETALYTQLSKLKKDLNDTSAKEYTEQQTRLLAGFEKIQKGFTEVSAVLTGALNAVSVGQKNRLADQNNEIDRSTAREIERINATTMAEEKKAAQIAIITARAQSQKDAIAAKQKKIDQDAAKTAKVFAVFQIALNTAIAITKVLGNPFQVALVAALGAAQLAVAIATPVPRFKHGKNAGDNYEGFAVLDDGGKNEPHLKEDGTIEMSTGPARDRLTWVGQNDIVFPSLDAMLKHFSTPKVGGHQQAKQDGTAELARMMARQTALLGQIAAKPDLHLGSTDRGMTALWVYGSNSVKYIDENTNW